MTIMKNLKILITTVILSFIVLTSCDKGEVEEIDNLQQTGVPGLWKLESREINGISGLAVECCDYIEFKTDSEPTDLKGKFKAFGVGYATNGVFELNTTDETIEFIYDDEQLLYEIQISENIIVFSYSEKNDSIIEHWRKEE
jgi:hypothetical protein